MKYSIWYILVVLVVASCSGSRKIAVKPPKKLESEEILAYLKKSNQSQNLRIKGRIEVRTTDDRYTASTTMQIQPGSAFTMNASKLGFEIFRMHVTRDSIIYVDRFNREYFHTSVREVQDFYEVDITFEMLESLVFGHILDLKNKRNLNIGDKGETVHLHFSEDLKEDYWYNALDFMLKDLSFQNSKGDAIFATFEDWEETTIEDISRFSMYRKYQIPMDGDTYQANLKVSKVEKIEDDDLRFSVPTHYTKVDF